MDKIWEVIELNKLGDHIVVKDFRTKIEALQFAGMMSQASNEGEEYYVNDRSREWDHNDD